MGKRFGFGLLDYDDRLFVTACPQVRAGLTGGSIAWAFTNGPLGEWYPLAMMSHMLDCQLFGLAPGDITCTVFCCTRPRRSDCFSCSAAMTGQRAVPEAAQASGGRVALAGPSATTPQRAVPEAAQASGGRVALAGPSATTPQRAVPEAAQASGGRVALAGPSATTPQRAVPEAAQASGGRVARAGPSATTLWPSALVAAIFAVHPQHVESVAWIAERRDVLSGLFFVLVLGAYLGYVRHGRSVGRYLLVALLLALGLMAKAMLVTVPPLLLLLDYWPLGRFGKAADLPNHAPAVPKQSFWQLVVEKLPLAAIALADCGLTLTSHAKDPNWVARSWAGGIANAIVSLAMYLVQFFYPADLAVFYPLPQAGYPLGEVAVAAAALIAISIAAVATRRRCPYLLVGWCWYLGMMVPVLGLVTVAEHARADRYMYLPSIGLSIALVFGAARLVAGTRVSRVWIGAAAALVLGLLLSQAVRQTSYWHDDLALWEHSLAVTEDNPEADAALAFALNKVGRVDDAVVYYMRAAHRRVDIELLDNLAMAVAQQGKLAEAAELIGRALEINPDHASSHSSLGFVLDQQGRTDEAAKQYRRAIALDPGLVFAQFNLADVLRRQGKIDEAIEHCRQAVQLAPDDEGARQLFDRLRHQQSDGSPGQ